MKNTIKIKNEYIEYMVIYKNKKNVSLKVKEDGSLLLYVPLNIDSEYIQKLIKQKENWILDKIEKIKQYKENDLLNKEKILFSGKYLGIVTQKAKTNNVSITEENIIVDTIYEDDGYIKNLMLKFLKYKSTQVIGNRAIQISDNIKIKPSKIIIKDQKSIWGSCNSKKEIRLNWRLALMPTEVMDYVIIHELSHIIHMNHSKDFWQTVKKYKPSYSDDRDWLKKYGTLLMNLE